MVLGMAQRRGGNNCNPTRGRFAGYCNYCGKYGHKATECFKRQRETTKVKSSDGSDKGKSVAFANVLQTDSRGPPYFEPTV